MVNNNHDYDDDYLGDRPQQRWNSTQLLAVLTCKVKSFSLLSLQAFFRGRGQTAKLEPNSLLASTRCCRMRPPHNKAESMVGRRAKPPTCLKQLPTGRNEPQQAQPKLAKGRMSTALL